MFALATLAATGVYAQSTVELYGRAEVTTELGKRQSLTSSTTTAAGVTTRNGRASVTSDSRFFGVGAIVPGTEANVFGPITQPAVFNTKPSFAVNDGNTTGDGSSRIGFKGTEDLGGGLKAVFQMEAGVNIDDGSAGNGGGNLFSRTAIVGLEGGFGRVTAGRQVNPTFSVQAQGSAMGTMNGYTDAGIGVMPVNVRSSNSIMYTTPDFGGLKVSALVSAAEAKGTSRARVNRPGQGQGALNVNTGEIENANSVVAEVSNNDKVGYSLGLNYASGPLYLGVGYDRRGQAMSANDFATGVALLGMNSKQDLWTLSAAYDFGVVRPFVNYSQQNNKWNGDFTAAFANANISDAMSGKEKAWALGLTAPVGTGTLFAEYGTSKTGSISSTRTIAGVTANQLLNEELSGKETAFSLGYRYPMSKRTWVQAAYGQYKQTATWRSTVNAEKVEDVTKSSGLALTLSHSF